MSALTIVQAALLFASTALSIWAVVVARTRRGVPGGAVFGWMLIAIALWSFTSGIHTLVEDRDARVLISKLQYFGVAPIGVLWLLFATQYSRVSWPAERALRVLVWAIPVATLLLAWTNEQHGFHWSAINEIQTPAGRRLVYVGGPWYWVNAAYSYFLVLIGTAMLVRGLRRFPPPIAAKPP